MTGKTNILIVDDERHTREALMRYLRNRFAVTGAEDGAQAIELLRTNDYDLVLTDLRMPGADGMSVLEAALAKGNHPACIVFTAYGTIEAAVAAVKAGAFDFVAKPVRLDRLDEVVAAALKHRAAQSAPAADPEPAAPADAGKTPPPIPGDIVFGESPAMQQVEDLIRQTAPSRVNIMLSGESGTGKEVIARAIHDSSGRKGLFVPVHCAALPANLLESELFGYERGAFTGAEQRRKGRFELADGGTLFLDEIGEIDPSTQVKLLRVLETRTVERIGGVEPVQCDVRLVSATNRNLAQMVAEGTFREDLFYRLEGVSIVMPPLRERRQDIPELARRFILKAAQENDRPVSGLDDQALALLVQYDWPGNIRELKHTIERMVVLARGNILTAADVPPEIRSGRPPQTVPPATAATAPRPPETAAPVTERLDESERVVIERALERCNGNRTHAAAALGISRRTLLRKLRAYADADAATGK